MATTSPELYVMIFHIGADLIGLGAVLWYAFNAARDIKEVKTNHIPHLAADIRDLKNAFVAHLIGEVKSGQDTISILTRDREAGSDR